MVEIKVLLNPSNDAACSTLIPQGNNLFTLYVNVYLKGTTILLPYSFLCCVSVLCIVLYCVLREQKSLT